ncbi:MAG: hypothetical protein KatS3mg119_0022 [Rhodothalassiaceae bacterium]|nr:MAG: hypothetical protein KatS3mg119_0022 [Rhodothalassiaceae bacterium]
MSAIKRKSPETLPLEHDGDIDIASTAMAWGSIRPPRPTREEMETDMRVWEAALARGLVPEAQKGRRRDAAKILCLKVNGEWRRVCEGPFHFTEEERKNIEWGTLCEEGEGGRVQPLESEPNRVRWMIGPEGGYGLLPSGEAYVKGVPFPEDDGRFRFYRKVLLGTFIPGIRALLREGDEETARARFYYVSRIVRYMAGRAEGLDPPRWAGRRGGEERARSKRTELAARNEKLAREIDRLLRGRRSMRSAIEILRRQGKNQPQGISTAAHLQGMEGKNGPRRGHMTHGPVHIRIRWKRRRRIRIWTDFFASNRFST